MKVERIYFTWGAGTDNIGVSKYEVYRNGAYLADTGTTCQFTDAGLSKDTNYSYYLKSVDGAGNKSAPSNTIILRTDDYADSFDDAYLVQNFTSGSSITGKFNTITDYDYFEVVVNKPATYNIDVASPNRDNLNCFVKLYGSDKSILKSFFYSNTFSNRNTLTAEPLAAAHYYIVVNSSRASAPTVGSSYLSLGTYNIGVSLKDNIPPAAPVLSVSGVSSNTVNLSWTASTDDSGIAYYEVWRDGSLIRTTTGLNYSDATSDTALYTYYVVAYDNAGNKSYSNQVSTYSAEYDFYDYELEVVDENDQIRTLDIKLSELGPPGPNFKATIIRDKTDCIDYIYDEDTGWTETGGIYAYSPNGDEEIEYAGLISIYKLSYEALQTMLDENLETYTGIEYNDLGFKEKRYAEYGVYISLEKNLGTGGLLHAGIAKLFPSYGDKVLNNYYVLAGEYTADEYLNKAYTLINAGTMLTGVGGIVKAGIKKIGKWTLKGILRESLRSSQTRFLAAAEATATFLKNINARNILIKTADETNDWWRTVKGYTDPPYTPGSTVLEFELDKATKFVRVYDDVNSPMKGQWFMKAEDIAGLAPSQIQNKFALPTKPKFVVDLKLPAGTKIRTGEANSLYGFTGKGVQFDAMGQYFDGWVNPRLLP